MRNIVLMADGTRDRILEATVRAMAAHGLSRLTLEDVAREAGTSRQTVHRHFGTKDALIEAAVVREEEVLIGRVAEAAARHDDARDAIEAAVDAALTAAREHPLLDRLLTTEPETLLPILTRGSGPVLAAPRPVIEELLTDRIDGLEAGRAAWAADVLTRLLISYAVNPPADVGDLPARLARMITEGLGNSR